MTLNKQLLPRVRPLLAAALAMLVGFTIGIRLQLAPNVTSPPQPSAIGIGFAQHMARHHDQAVLIASVFVQNYHSGLVPLARSIVESQLLELGKMRGWLKLWNQKLAPESRSMEWMLAGSSPPDEKLQAYLLNCETTGSMPGMASGDELRQLADAQETNRHRLFLQLMLRHHEGGLPMLDFAAHEASLAPVRQLADRMLLTQGREMGRMQLQLTTLNR